MQIRYALLVGIDHYPNDKTRGSNVSMDDLKECVNDVQSLRKVLESEYGFEHITTLLSPPEGMDSQNASAVESADAVDYNRLPTFSHIQEEFESVQAKANEGDLFFFHFSGHGAKLNRVRNTPYGQREDPSLMTADYCCGGPALRGWQLNTWLEKLNKKGIQVVVSLDSCCYGGSWQDDDNTADETTYRTPKNWPSVPNLPTDNIAASLGEENDTPPPYSDNIITKPWFINPEAITLMTACADNQKAREVNQDGIHRGAFTHELLEYLKDNRYHATYHMAQDDLRERLAPQTPTVHGRDQFFFFGNSEPFHSTRMEVDLDGRSASIPSDGAHGVQEGAEVLSLHSTSGHTLSVDSVEEFESTIGHFDEIDQALEQCEDRVTKPWWPMGKEIMLRLLVDSSLGSEFLNELQQLLQCSIANEMEINDVEINEDESIKLQSSGNDAHYNSGTGESTVLEKFWNLSHWFYIPQNANQGQTIATGKGHEDIDGSPGAARELVFKLLQGEDRTYTDIVGPESLAQYTPSIRIKSDGENFEAHAVKVASSLIHMARFEQTLRLKPKTYGEDQPSFVVSLRPSDEQPERRLSSRPKL